MGFWKFIQRRGREAKNFENCVFVIQFAPNLGKPAFLILSRENMGVPWPGVQEKYSKVGKLKNLGFPHFPYYIEPSLLSPHRGAYCIKSPHSYRLMPGLFVMHSVHPRPLCQLVSRSHACLDAAEVPQTSPQIWGVDPTIR